MSKAPFDVLVIGSPCVDLVFSGLPHWPVPGQEMYVTDFAVSVGAIFNTAATLSRLGLHVGLLCELGNDFFSRYMLEEIERAGISRDLIFVRPHPLRSVSVCLPYEGERGFISYADPDGSGENPAGEVFLSEQHTGGEVAAHGFAADMQAALEKVSCTAAFLYVYPKMRRVLEFLRRQGTTIFLDAGWSPNTLTNSLLGELARYGDYFMPNQAEAALITGTATAEAAVQTLARMGPTPIIKLGAQGVIAYRDNVLFRCPAFPVANVVDTTGAGDAFDAGFIYGTLHGYAFSEALRCGTICGSLSATALTGTATTPTAETLERLRASWV